MRLGGFGGLAGCLLRRHGGPGLRFGAVQLLLGDLVLGVQRPVADGILGGTAGFRLGGGLLRFGLSLGRLGGANRGGSLRDAGLEHLHLVLSRAGRGASLRQNRFGHRRREQQIRLRAIRPRGSIGQAGAGFRRARLVIACVKTKALAQR